MVDIRIEGRVLDVFEGLDFSFNYSIADIRDPNKRSTEYSKTIKCPSTPNNDYLLGQIYDVNISNDFNPNGTNIEVNFNPNKKASAVVLADGVQVMRGVVQLRQIVVNQTKMIYEVVFIGKLIDIFSLLGDKQLNGLNDDGTPYIDFSDLDHDYDYGRITSSWSNTTGYVYPMIDYGNYQPFFDANGNRIWRTEMWRPAVFLKDIVDRIFSFVGFTYDSNFFDSAPFNRLIVPFSNEGFTLTEVDVANREVSAQTTQDLDVINKVAPNAPNGPFDYDFKIEYESANDPNNIWDDINSDFIVPQDGFYSLSGVMKYKTERNATGGIVGNFPVTVLVKKFSASTSSVVTLSAIQHPIELSSVNTIGATSFSNFGFDSPSIFMYQGDKVFVEININATQFAVVQSQFDVYLLQDSFVDCKVSDTSIIEGQNVPMNSLAPDVGMAEMLLSVFKMLTFMLPLTLTMIKS